MMRPWRFIAIMSALLLFAWLLPTGCAPPCPEGRWVFDAGKPGGAVPVCHRRAP